MYDTVDTQPDPNPDKAKAMTVRIRGSPLVGTKPPSVFKLENRIRVWQVKPILIEENHHWLTTGRVAASGKAWGDDEDPIDVKLEAAKESRAKLVGSRKRKRAMVNLDSASNAKARLDEELGGVDEDVVFKG